MRLLWGGARRLWANWFRRGYVQAQLTERKGECLRCGACCRLSWPCPHYLEQDGMPSCRVYGRTRPPNCGSFPIDPRDLADRNLILPGEPCGYRWDADEKPRV